ncbi:hypothetical protein [Larkinella terrae]|uniref:pPIWI_RE_Z domain-containing protein n=1 Tax=Larkinella terrae TaxID=2025311 RepID=UPI0014784551|nr:hypothetical protein [Larkinella terrae]
MNTLASLAPAFYRHATTANSGLTSQRPTRRLPRLSARQLFDVELGLFLLSELMPSASPVALPGLLSSTDSVWTPRQHKLRSRGLALLTHLSHFTHWCDLLETYMAVPVHLQAYDISRDYSSFRPKTVGFSRNRLSVLRKVLS